MVVLAGLVVVAVIAVSTVLGWDARLASATEAYTPPTRPSLSLTGEASASVGAPVVPVADTVPSTFASSLEDDTGAPAAEGIVAGSALADVSASAGVALGKVVEANFHSTILDKDLLYRVYLPAGYDSGNQRYPVLYLLHGNGTGLFAEWTDSNRIGVIADAEIAAGKIQPMIIAMPDGEHSYFMNHYGDGERWQDYILDEFLPFVDANFRTIPDKMHRAIGGHSMGGAAALMMAFEHPELFAAVGAHSPSLHWTSDGGPEYFGPNDYYAQYNPLEMAKTAKNLDTLKIWVDFGDQDPWLPAGAILEPTLKARGIDPQWHIFPGDHYTTYWIEHGPDYLEYYSTAMAGPKVTTGW